MLGPCGYKPEDVKKRIPIYEINQVIHAILDLKGVVLDWSHNTAADKTLRQFETLRNKPKPDLI